MTSTRLTSELKKATIAIIFLCGVITGVILDSGIGYLIN